MSQTSTVEDNYRSSDLVSEGESTQSESLMDKDDIVTHSPKRLTDILLGGYLIAKDTLEKRFFLTKEIECWKQKASVVIEQGRAGYRVKTESLGITTEGWRFLQEHRQPSGLAVIAYIDHDGFLLSQVGPISLTHVITEEEYRERKRAHLRLVDVDGYAGVCKNYRGKYWPFINELRALHLLGLAGCNVPSILHIDFDAPMLTYSYILGRVLAEEIAQRGVVIRNRDLNTHLLYKNLDSEERQARIIVTARRVLHETVDHQFMEDLTDELKKIHAARILWNDIKYGNVMIEETTGKPFLIDFDHSRCYPKLMRVVFDALCNRELRILRFVFSMEHQG